MNLLIYVTALLLSLSALSYQSLSRFQSNADKEKFWNRRLQVDSICAFNERVSEQYDELKEKPEKKQNEKEENPAPLEAYAKINFKFLINARDENTSPEDFAAYEEVAKRLIKILYGEQTFFKNLLSKNSNVLDLLFPALRQAQSEQKRPVGLVRNLMNIPLKEEDLMSLWYILCKKAALGPFANLAMDPRGKEKECTDTCFTDFLGNKGTKIRVFLADPALLLALYDEESLVLQILEKRDELHKQAKKMETVDPLLSQEFKAQFQGRSPYDEILDFTVSKTSPEG